MDADSKIWDLSVHFCLNLCKLALGDFVKLIQCVVLEMEYFTTSLFIFFIFLISAAVILKNNRTIKNFFKNFNIFKKSNKNIVPVSVNYHFTRKCNYECGFCFHTAKTSHVVTLDEAKIGLQKLADKGMKKLNLSGGEPFTEPKFVGEICKFCKEVLKLESVSIVSNGSLIKERFFINYAKYVDILAISVDSFDEETNIKIGRGKGRHLEQLRNVAEWCEKYSVKFKLNSVINVYNWQEDFTENILGLAPFRWKVFQVLPVDTENTGHESLRNCAEFLISDEQFQDFCQRHRHLQCFVPESNRMMKSSYIILDEYLRFLNKGDTYRESKSILDVSVEEAMGGTDWEPEIFLQRGGVYDWARNSQCQENGCTQAAVSNNPNLQW